MKNIALIAISLFIFSINLLAQESVSSSEWKSNVIIDPQSKEWIKPINFYNNETGIKFGVSNDSSILYLFFSVNDELKIKKMLRAGWSIELSSTEKKNKFDAGISFPVLPMNKETNNGSDKGRKKVDINEMFSTYKLQIASISAKGFKTKNGELPLTSANGININLGLDSIQNIFYVITIPLSELFTKTAIQLNEVLTLKVTVNALQNQSYSGSGSGGGHSGGGHGGGGGMHGGGGMSSNGMGGNRTGGGSSGSTDRSALFEKATLKQKFKLVNK